MKYRDMFGNEIKVGDYIVYSAADGRSACMRFGQVTDLTVSKEGNLFEKKIPKVVARTASNFHGPHSKLVSLAFLDRIVVIPLETANETWIESLEHVGRNETHDWNYWSSKYQTARRL